MKKEPTISGELARLQQLIEAYQEQATQLHRPSAALVERLERLSVLHRALQQHAQKSMAAPERLHNDDWKQQLAAAELAESVKIAVRKTIEQHPEGNALALVQAVERFYTHRYHNPKKFMEGLQLPKDISEEQYHGFLEAAVVHTLKHQGIQATEQDLGASLILLLKGRLTINDVKKGDVQYRLDENPFGGTQIAVEVVGKELPELGKLLTKRFNDTTVLKKAPFDLQAVAVALSVTLVVARQDNKVLSLEAETVAGWLPGALDVLSHELTGGFKDFDCGAAVAASEGKMSLRLGDLGQVDLGFKVAQFELAFREGAQFVPFEGFVKWEMPLSVQEKLLAHVEPMILEALTCKVEIELSITPEIGLKADAATQAVSKKMEQFVQEQEDLLERHQNSYHKKQLAYNNAVDQKHSIEALQQEARDLDDQVKKMRGNSKQKDLLIKRGRLKTQLRKEVYRYQKGLDALGVDDLQGLKDQVLEKSAHLDRALQQIQRRYDKALDRITKPATKLAAQLIQKQAAKRLVSLAMKAVPGLNVLSLAWATMPIPWFAS